MEPFSAGRWAVAMGVGEAAGGATLGLGAADGPLRVPRPRVRERQAATERLLRLGAAALCDAELLTILLGGARQNLLVPELAQRFLEAGGGLKALVQTDPQELCTSNRLGRKKGPLLLAALELGRRAQKSAELRPKLSSPRELYQHLAPALGGQRREAFHVLCFNARNVLLLDACVAQGSTSECPVDPREVFAPALNTRATAIVLAHNHPSGDVRPSAADLELTARLCQGGALLGIRVMDHLVIGDGSFSSLLELGLMPSSSRPKARPCHEH